MLEMFKCFCSIEFCILKICLQLINKHFLFLNSFLREELEVTDEMDDDIDLADLLPKVYEPVLSWNILETKLITHMTKMNEEIRSNKMDLVFFKDAMIHLLRVKIFLFNFVLLT